MAIMATALVLLAKRGTRYYVDSACPVTGSASRAGALNILSLISGSIGLQSILGAAGFARLCTDFCHQVEVVIPDAYGLLEVRGILLYMVLGSRV